MEPDKLGEEIQVQQQNQQVAQSIRSRFSHLHTKTVYGYAVAFGVVLVLVSFLFAKGYIIAAVVDGSLISRYAIVSELEKQGGKQTLDLLIEEKLITNTIKKEGVTVTKEEIEKKLEEIESRLVTSGGSLDEALSVERMTRNDLNVQIERQLQLEKLFQDKIVVTAEEVDAYILENKLDSDTEVPQEEIKTSVQELLRQEKFQTEAQQWLLDIKADASVKYFVTYK